MPTPPSTTVLKAFELLELFIDRPLLGAGETARLLNAPRASTHRMLVTLRAAGVLESTKGGQYRLGLRLFELGSSAPLRRRLHETCLPALESLAATTCLPTHLAVRDGDDLVCLEKVNQRQIDVPIHVGQRAPLHTTAAGKVLLAYAPHAVIERYTADGVERSTPFTISDPQHLLTHLAQIRAHGLAWDREESCLGLAALAAPVLNRTGKVIAAISVSAATFPDTHDLQRAERPLRLTTAKVERGLGYCQAPAEPVRRSMPA